MVSIEPQNAYDPKFNQFLKDNYPHVIKCKEYLLSNLKFGQLYGEMMSGKTKTMIAILHFYNLNNRSAIIVLQNLNDVDQFESSINEYNKECKTYYKEKGWDFIPFKYELASSLELGDDFDIGDPCNLKNAFKIDKKSFTIVSISHPVQLFRIFKLLYQEIGIDGCFKSYCMVYDESHLTMHPVKSILKLEEIDEPENVKSWNHSFRSLSKYECITHLISHSDQVIATTATPARNFFSNQYSFKFIISIKPKESYRDVLSIQYNIIPDLQTKIDEDKSIHTIIKELSEKEIYDKEKYNMTRNHPIFLFVQVSRFKKNHYLIRDYILNNHEDKFVIITHNNDGTEVHFTSRISKYIRDNLNNHVEIKYGYKVRKTESQQLDKNNEVVFLPEVPITSILQFCANLPEHLLERIVFIAGDRVRQGRRINSEDFSIRITHQILRDSNSKCDNAMQKLRIVGYVYDDRPPLVVYCTNDMHRNIITNIKNTRDILDKLEVTLNSNTNALEVLESCQMSKQKLGTTQMCKTKVPMKIVDEDIDDFKLSVDDYIEDFQNTVESIVLDDKVVKKKNSITNSSNDLRLILEDSIGNTRIMKKIYKETVTYMLIVGKGVWINRSNLINYLCEKGLGHRKEKHLNERQRIEAHLKVMYQTKYTTTDVVNTTTGLLMRKMDGIVQLRLN